MSTQADHAAGAAAHDHERETHFKRVLGLPALVFFGLAYMVPLTVWTTYGIVTTSTDGHLPLAYTVTTIAMALTAYSYGRMVLVQPIAGSAYSYASKAFGRPLGFMVGWALMLDYIFLPMINYLLIGLYMQDYLPSTPQALWIILAVLLVTGLNILGIRLRGDGERHLRVRAVRLRRRLRRHVHRRVHERRRGQVVHRAVHRVGHRLGARSSPARRCSPCPSSASTRSRRSPRRPRTRGARSRWRSCCARSPAA